MKKFIISLMLLLVAISFQAQQNVSIEKSQIVKVKEGKRYYVHMVLAGQTVYSIAKAYESTVDEIYYENPESTQGISIGDQLWIPVISKETELNKELKFADFEFFYHITESGENYKALSKTYNIPEEYIQKANTEIKAPFREGEYIKIPAETAFNKLDGVSDLRIEVEPEVDLPAETVSFDPNIPVVPNFRHTVKPGETTASIAMEYEVDLKQLKAVNIGLGNTVKPGDRLRIPQVKKKKEKPEYINYRVKKKETLYSISRQYGLTVKDLFIANEGLTEDIDEGQIIRIPKKEVEDEYLVFTVPSRTRLNKVAKLYGIPAYEIRDANPGIENRLSAGEKVNIPKGDKAIIAKPEPEVSDSIVALEEGHETETPGAKIEMDCRKIFKSDTQRVFKVAMMIPFYLEEIEELDTAQFLLSEQDNFDPFRFVKFYEGALIAIDSLEKQGMHIELYVYDVDQSITKTAKVLKDRNLRQMDLIIGPFFSRNFDQVALFAGNFGIPIVNPFSYRDEIVQNYKTVFKVNPGEKYQLEILQKLLPAYYEDANVFLITQTAYKDADKIMNLQHAIFETIPFEVHIENRELYELGIDIAKRDENYNPNRPLPVFMFEEREIQPDILSMNMDGTTAFNNRLTKINYAVDSLHPFYKKASPLRENLVIVYSDNKAFVMDVMNRLNEHRDTFDIQLIGIPSWDRFNEIDQYQASNLNLTYFTSSYVDYKQERIQDVIYKFRERYKTEPGITGFTGFDVTYYFLSSLFYIDKRFERCVSDFSMDMTQNIYHFTDAGKDHNYENKGWNILRYNNLKLTKLRLPE
ncbi:MAG: LysM peptidoglycan-binding domain-containing protein [Bacteroidetes bacterium]|nr:LysM peptidoglycan-binding domain-containing protein [Bacteroidota bacterium]